MPIHLERHYAERIGWLRASVLGANDGIVSIASLLIGVAAANADKSAVLISGIAGLVAGAMSMAAGEYVSVSSQSDTELADRARERSELETMPENELEELTTIYQKRGLQRELAEQVAKQLTAHNALEAHLRDELGLTEVHSAQPIQAAFASAGTFAVGAALPLLVAWLSPGSWAVWLIAGSSLAFLAGMGALAAKTGGAGMLKAAFRVTFWGALAMLVTALIGMAFGVAVG